MSDLPYFTAIGAWGDVFACYSRICLMMKELGLAKANMIHYGFDPHIKDFLEYQDNIEDVLYIKPESWQMYEEVIAEANTGTKHWITDHWMTKFHRIPAEQIILGNLNHDIIHRKEIHRHFDYKLPPSNVTAPSHSIMFHPYSFQSCSFQAHWPYMAETLMFLVKETDWHVVLTGQEKTFNVNGEYWDFPFVVDHPRVTNLVGKTESMLEVFSITEDCEAIITTSNCLGLWAIISDKPSIVLMNSKMTEPFVPGHEYWQAWYEAEINKRVYHNQDFECFKRVYSDFSRWLQDD